MKKNFLKELTTDKRIIKHLNQKNVRKRKRRENQAFINNLELLILLTIF